MDSFRWPSSGAVSSPVSAPLVVALSIPHATTITHTQTTHTSTLNRRHICTHKASHDGARLRRRRLRRMAALGGGSATAATARLRRNRQRRRRNRQLRQNRWRLRRKSAAVTLRRRLRYRRLQPLQRCAAVRIWRREMRCRSPARVPCACLAAALAALVAASGSSGCARPKPVHIAEEAGEQLPRARSGVCWAAASILQSGKRRRGARDICASIALAARKKPLLRHEHDHAAGWLQISVYKNKCMVLCTLASSNGCVSASTRRETSHIDRPPRLAARRAAGPRRRAQQ